VTSASSNQRHLGHRGRHEIVRRHNVRAVLRAVYELGPASRAAIAAASGLSKPAVGTLIEQQVEAGLLRVERARIEGRDRDVFGFADGIGPFHHQGSAPGAVTASSTAVTRLWINAARTCAASQAMSGFPGFE